MKTIKITSLFILLACALAATTALTPIVAKTVSAPQSDEQDCRAQLATIVHRINTYREEHGGKFPWSLNEIGGPFYCPEHYTRVKMLTGEIFKPNALTPEALEAFQALVRSIDWNRVPIVMCTSHFDRERVDNIVWEDRSEQNLPPRPMAVPKPGVENAYLGAPLNGNVGYYEQDDEVLERISAFFRAGPYLRQR